MKRAATVLALLAFACTTREQEMRRGGPAIPREFPADPVATEADPTPTSDPVPTPTSDPVPTPTPLPKHPCDGYVATPPIPPDEDATPETSELDTTFSADGRLSAFPMLEIHDVDELPDGKLGYTGDDHSGWLTVCRVGENGERDLSFGDCRGCAYVDLGGYARGHQLVRNDAGITVTGYGPDTGAFIARLTEDGALDTTFLDTGWGLLGPVFVRELLQVGSQLILGGGRYGGGSAFLSRLNEDGTLDTSFGNAGFVDFAPGAAADRVVRTEDGRFIATTQRKLHAFLSDGSIDLAFGDGDGVVDTPFWAPALAVTDDALYVAGVDMRTARYSLSGTLLEEYGPLEPVSDSFEIYLLARDMAVLADGTIVLGGIVSIDSSTDEFGIGRRLPNGAPDESFYPGGARQYAVGSMHDFEVLRDGRYVLAGTRAFDFGLIFRIWN